MSWLLVLSLLTAPATDPRAQVAQLIMDDEVAAALVATERFLALDPESGARLGFSYLRGRLLDRLGRSREAADAFLEAVSSSPRFNYHSFLRLALDYERLGHPEMAAGLAAKVVAAGQPADRIGEASALLRRVLQAGGDCRVLAAIRENSLAEGSRRQIQLARAECAALAGEMDKAARGVMALLTESRRDESGREAARLAVRRLRVGSGNEDYDLALLVGLTFHDHREFAQSSWILDTVFSAASDAASSEAQAGSLSRAEFDSRYARVRNDFWQGHYRQASSGFARLAAWAAEPEQQAKAWFQVGRCQETEGDWTAAAKSYRRAYATEPQGDWASAGLLAALRLEWRSGQEESALELYQLLRSKRSWRGHTARAALFLAASDLVRGRGDRAGPWLDQARRSGARVVEVAYWRGRWVEAQLAAGVAAATPAAAVGAYLTSMRAATYHPLAQAARARLRQPRLAAVAHAEGTRLARSGRESDLYAAWLLLGGLDPNGRRALQTLASRLARDPVAGPFLRMGPAPIERWVLWKSSSSDPDQALLALGLWDEGASVISRFFPVTDPDLAFTGSLLLARSGQTRRALTLAEVLAQRLPAKVPSVLLPAQYRRLLYPLPYREMLTRAAAAGTVDPLLLASVIREESRFDPKALSNASARGLTQFTLQTARRFSDELGIEDFSASDLYRPEISIALGAAYISDLRRQFGNADHAVVASYNAGEDQARVWLGHCFSRELAEYYTKVGFDQTRNYLRKVFTSWAQYREIYGEVGAVDQDQLQLPGPS